MTVAVSPMTGALGMARAHRATPAIRTTRAARLGAVALVTAIALCVSPPPAGAISLNPVKKICGVAEILSGLLGKACAVLQGGRLAKAGEKLLGGDPAGAAKALVTGGGAARAAGVTLGLAAVGAWVLGGARAALRETENEIGKTTSPRLQSTWFSATYWRVAGLAALLTLPFLFAAALQALLRSDLSLLARAAFGYLPLALLAVSITAPLTLLVLAASDEMCAIVSSASGGAGVGFLKTLGGFAGGLSVVDGSTFLAFLLGAFIAGAALAVSLELLVREAAVYVVVLMLPLAFAGMVWPARRIWAVRAVETLVALILAKFAIVAVLALAGGALGAGGASGMFAGTALLMLAAFSPLVLFRLLPFAELAAGASGALRGEGSRLDGHVGGAAALSDAVELWASSTTGGMRSDAELPADAADGSSDAAPRPDPGGRSGRAPAGADALDAPAGVEGARDAPAGAEAAADGLAGAGATAADGLAGAGAGGGGGATAADMGSPAPRPPLIDPRWLEGEGESATLVLGPDSWPTAPVRSRGEDDAPAGDQADGERTVDTGPLPPDQDDEGGRL